jgi:hypothetical protein
MLSGKVSLNVPWNCSVRGAAVALDATSAVTSATANPARADDFMHGLSPLQLG